MIRLLLSIVGVILITFLCAFDNNDQMDELAQSYIDNYKELAILEMERSGIPASIILAQGLHETNHGTSRLSIEANNHFGIKCKKYWQGKYYYHKDDDYDISGNLVESCFRAYDSAIDSYVDHSNYLVTSKFYSSLFKLKKDDYKSWAYGLKQCGYATDSLYAEKLVGKIEKYDLHHYDEY